MGAFPPGTVSGLMPTAMTFIGDQLLVIDQAVAYALLGYQVLGIDRVVFDLSTQVADIHVQIVNLSRTGQTPDLAQQILVG